MRVAITGGLGSIGRKTLRLLAGGRHEVLAIDVHPGPTDLLPPGCTYARASVTDPAALIGLLQTWRPEVILHLAAILGEVNVQAPRTCLESNLLGTLNVLDAARLTGARRIVVASTWRVYDVGACRCAVGAASTAALYVTEDAPTDPLDPYAIAKYSAEKLGSFYHRRYDLEFAAVRFSCYFGPQRATGGRLRGLAAALNGIILATLRQAPAEIAVDPRIPFDAVYVKDCAAGVAAACLTPVLPHRAYNIGSGVPTTLSDVARAAAELWGVTPISFHPDAPLHDPLVLRIDRARADLGYAPAFSLQEALVDFARESSEAPRPV